MGNWLPEAVEFVKINQQALNRVPVALFSVHMLITSDDEQRRTNRKAYFNSVRPLLQPLDEATFAGKIDFSRLTFVDRLITKLVKVREADLRDWNKIRSWAQTIFA